MCRYGTRLFDPQVTQTRAARRWIVEQLGRWELEPLADELELAGSELATNALLHTRSGFAVTLAVCGGAVELAVRDRDPRPPVLRPARLDLLADVESLAAASSFTGTASHGALEGEAGAPERHSSLHVGPAGSIAAGRGIIIVDAIADEWGVASHAAGKDVWLRMPVPRDWKYLHECRCDELAGRAPSGYPVRHLTGEWDAG